MDLSKEEAERIVTEFDKVANRVDKKTNQLSSKMMLGIMVIAVIVIAVIVYLFLYRQKKGKDGKPAEIGGEGEAFLGGARKMPLAGGPLNQARPAAATAPPLSAQAAVL